MHKLQSKRVALPIALLITLTISGCTLSSVPGPENSTSTPNTTGQPTATAGTPQPTALSPQSSQAEAIGVPAERQAAVQVVERISPAVVTVVNRFDQQGIGGEASGSGVIIDPEGRIITNYHVIEGFTEDS